MGKRIFFKYQDWFLSEILVKHNMVLKFSRGFFDLDCFRKAKG